MPGSKVIVKNQMDPMQIQQKPYTRVVCNSNADPIQSMDANLIETIELSTSRVEPSRFTWELKNQGLADQDFFMFRALLTKMILSLKTTMVWD
jgi:hypothetical protein